MAIYIVLAVVLIVVVAVTLLGMFAAGFIPLAPSYNKMDRFITANIEELTHVIDALSELDYDTIEIRKYPSSEEEKHSMDVRNGDDREIVPIPDELVGHIEALFNSGVNVISYGRDSIGFSMWASLSESRGVKFSRTGEPPEVWAAIEVRPLSEENWYYYVSNFDKWKVQNPHLFQ